jgi:hypothetical protein
MANVVKKLSISYELARKMVDGLPFSWIAPKVE